jgi:uncharacterized membrane protein YphA (DoxX/SURF4 family)
MASSRTPRNRRSTPTGHVLLWVVQVLLALVFLFAGVAKLRMAAALLEQFTGLPGAFMKFIAVAEICGALGLVLPGVLRIKRALTPVAAVGLVTVMSGAVTLTVARGPVAAALTPLVVGILAALVAHGRRAWLQPLPSDPSAREWVATPTLATTVHLSDPVGEPGVARSTQQ